MMRLRCGLLCLRLEAEPHHIADPAAKGQTALGQEY